MRLACVLPAKNEEQYLPKTLEALTRQGVAISPLIVVDDGSEDATAVVARQWGATVIDGPGKRPSSRTLRVCRAINEGVSHLPPDTDYVLTIGADDVLGDELCARLLQRMQANPRLVIASGRVEGDRVNPRLPRGTRMIDYGWWGTVDPPRRYVEIRGWETRLVLYAWWKGYETAQFADLVSVPQRTVGAEANWADRGSAMKLNGASLAQAYWRGMQLVFLQGRIRQASTLLSGYLNSEAQAEPWMVSLQRDLVRQGLARRLLGKGKATLATTDY